MRDAAAEQLPDDDGANDAWFVHALTTGHPSDLPPGRLELVPAPPPRADLVSFIQRVSIVLGAISIGIALTGAERRWSNQPAFEQVRAVRQDLHSQIDSLRQDVRSELTSTRWDVYLLATALAARDSSTRSSLLSQIHPPRTSTEGVSR